MCGSSSHRRPRARKEQIGAAASSMKEKARAMADDQKAAGAERLSGFARAINVAADQLEDELPQAASYVREAAAKVDDVSTMIRERSIEDLMHEANRFARANTVAFFGISLVAGFRAGAFPEERRRQPFARRPFAPDSCAAARTCSRIPRARPPALRPSVSRRFPAASSDAQET